MYPRGGKSRSGYCPPHKACSILCVKGKCVTWLQTWAFLDSLFRFRLSHCLMANKYRLSGSLTSEEQSATGRSLPPNSLCSHKVKPLVARRPKIRCFRVCSKSRRKTTPKSAYLYVLSKIHLPKLVLASYKTFYPLKFPDIVMINIEFFLFQVAFWGVHVSRWIGGARRSLWWRFDILRQGHDPASVILSSQLTHTLMVELFFVISLLQAHIYRKLLDNMCDEKESINLLANANRKRELLTKKVRCFAFIVFISCHSK